GVWPALPVTGYLLFKCGRITLDIRHLPLCCSVALMTVAGLSAWSGVLLCSVVAGVYRGGYLGALGWGVTLLGLWTVARLSRKEGSLEDPVDRVGDKSSLPTSHADLSLRTERHAERSARHAPRTRQLSSRGAKGTKATRLRASVDRVALHDGKPALWNSVLAAGLLLA